MSLLEDKFQMVTQDPRPGAYGGIWEDFIPEEVATAEAAGVGPGVPAASGTFAPGTIPPGRILELNSNGRVQDGNSQDITANYAKVFWVAFEGDTDFSSAYAGKVTCVHGGMRIETTQFVTGQSYVSGRPVIVSGGQLAPKAAVGDHIQAVGIVGPNGVNADGVLDVYLVQGIPTV